MAADGWYAASSCLAQGVTSGGHVKTRQIVGILLVVVGLVSLVWGGISWTREETILDLGPLQATTRERESIPMPPIIGGLLLAGGVVLLLVKPKKA